MPRRVWEVAKAALRWPVIAMIDGDYRRIPLRSKEGAILAAASEGHAVVSGPAQCDGELLSIGSVRVDRSASLLLLDEAKLGRSDEPVFAIGVLQRTPDMRGPFFTYRDTPELQMLNESCVMDVAAWAYYRSGPVGRLAYRIVGVFAGILTALRSTLSTARRAAVAAGISLLALAVLFSTGALVLRSGEQIASSFVVKKSTDPPAVRVLVSAPAAQLISSPAGSLPVGSLPDGTLRDGSSDSSVGKMERRRNTRTHFISPITIR